MLSTLPLVKILANKDHAARRIATRLAAVFVPTGNLTPVISEALCYGCMAGIAMPFHHDIAPCDRGHDDLALKLNDNSTATPGLHDSDRKQ